MQVVHAILHLKLHQYQDGGKEPECVAVLAEYRAGESLDSPPSGFLRETTQ
jgi:hypothetical protein